MDLLCLFQISVLLSIVRGDPILTGIVRGDPIPTRRPCREPDDSYMNRMRRSVLEDFVYMFEAHVQIDEVTKQKERDCPSRSLLSGENTFSLCPTYQELDRDERRTPSDFIQTRCRCNRCAMRRRRHYQYTCAPVFRYIPVLMRVGCTNGIYDYMVAEEKVSVACVCTEKLKSKLGRRTNGKTEPDMEHHVSRANERNSETEKMATNHDNMNQSQHEQRYTESEKMPDNFESLTGDIDSTQNENNVEEFQDHPAEETLPDTEKMSNNFEALGDAVDSTEEIQTEIQVSETEKMPDVYASRGGMTESTERNAERESPNQRGMTSNPTSRMANVQPKNTFIPDNPKMPTDYEDIHEHHISNERMPK